MKMATAVLTKVLHNKCIHLYTLESTDRTDITYFLFISHNIMTKDYNLAGQFNKQHRLVQ